MLEFVVKKNQIVWTKRFFAHNVKAGLDLYDLYLIETIILVLSKLVNSPIANSIPGLCNYC